MFHRFLFLCVTLGFLADAAGADSPDKSAAPPQTGNSRTFEFTYAATVTGLKPDQVARIWLPVPPSNEDQEVKAVHKSLRGKVEDHTESEYGNKILYLEAKADDNGTVPLSVNYRVTRKEIKGYSPELKGDMEKLARFLEPDANVPIDGKPLELIKDKQLPDDPMAAARALYDVVNGHMKYSKQGKGWGRGDSNWACEMGYGNCSDFHSLFISLARAQKIPAKFEIGFPLPDKTGSGDIPGYHCWAKFHIAGKGWVPVDISEANKDPKMKDYYFGNLTDNRVAFSTGRDITLAPKQAGGPLNFFIYPYVEVDGKALPAESVQKKFSFRDVDARD